MYFSTKTCTFPLIRGFNLEENADLLYYKLYSIIKKDKRK